MILIVSESNDKSTNKVIDWLICYNYLNFVRVNVDEPNILDKLCFLNKECYIDIERIDSKNIQAIWYRRGVLKIKTLPILLQDSTFNSIIKDQVNDEIRTLSEFSLKYLYNIAKIKIGDYFRVANLNKLDVLSIALKLKIKIPETIVTSQKQNLIPFYSKHKKIITKPISDVRCFSIDNKNFVYTYTHLLNDSDINTMEDTFFPSLFQQYIEKKYELRIFYLKNKFYSMAIFSQYDYKTCVDFRNYNFEKPNRCVPFNLPCIIKRRFTKLMKKLKMDSGSLDVIVDFNDNYYFLEVNPVGQYEMVNTPCNYGLHQKIALTLMNKKIK